MARAESREPRAESRKLKAHLFISRAEEETEEFGRKLAASLRDCDVVYLVGNLGCGKTCLARGLARGLGASKREVASPSFALLHEYAGSKGEIVLRHLDLYRLKDTAGELEVLGLPDSVAGAPVVVEWPGQAIRRVLPPTLEVVIEASPKGGRSIRVRPRESPGSERESNL